MAGIVFGCVSPHPPLLIPDIGHGQERTISSTINALEKLAEELGESQPDTLVLVSPHGAVMSRAMGVATCPSSQGDLAVWGSSEPEYIFDNDLELVRALQEEAKSAGISLQSIGQRGYDLDHGVLVPMHFLVEGAAGLPLVPLTFSMLPLRTHFSFGQAIRRAAERTGRRVAFVASGDLSHRLIPGTPAGYDPAGKEFDQKISQALSAMDARQVLELDPDLIERAGECGLRSIVMLLGALDGLKVTPEVLSYEGPFGVGYLVAGFNVETVATADEGRSKRGRKAEGETMHPLVALAKQAVESYVREGKVIEPQKLTPEMKERAGVFVSIKKHGQLRGCIGTFEPCRANVAEEVVANAISSATGDPRFYPVESGELSDLSYSVDVLTKPQPAPDAAKLDPKRDGVIVQCGPRRGLLLPDLEGVDTVDDQIRICRLKAGIGDKEKVKLYCFQVKRYK